MEGLEVNEELVEAFTHPVTGVKVGNHLYRLRLYKEVFIGI